MHELMGNGMRLGVGRGNRNRAVWRDVTILDGEVYRLPTGEVVRAKVVPDPDGLPEYWEEAAWDTHRWPVGRGLRLSVPGSGPAAGEREHASIGPAEIRYLTAACAGLVPGSLGYCVRGVNGAPEVWREVREDDGRGRRTGWTVADLVV